MWPTPGSTASPRTRCSRTTGSSAESLVRYTSPLDRSPVGSLSVIQGAGCDCTAAAGVANQCRTRANG